MPSLPASLEARLASVTPPKSVPTKVDASRLPPLVRTDGRPFEPALVTGFLHAAMTDTPVGMRDAITPESGDAFATALFDLWREKGFHGRHGWIASVMQGIGGARAALALEPLVIEWAEAGETGKERAKEALGWLRNMGTDTALLVLIGLRHKVVKPSVIEAAVDALKAAAEDRKLSLSELADRITPTLGLDGSGTRTLSYGPRSFTLALDANFEPRLRSASGEVLFDLPEPDPGDDPVQVAEARLQYSVLYGQLGEAVKVQSFRLEQDMIGGRRWDVSTWTRSLKEHPLLVSFTRRLLWGVYDKKDQLVTCFRTSEDQSLVDLDDEVFTLPATARVGIVHPLHLDEARREAWAQHFDDYRILPPFPQLQRAVLTPTAEERTSGKVVRFAGDRFKSGVIRDVLVQRGWDRDPAYERKFYRRAFPGVAAIAHLDPGVLAGTATYAVHDQQIPRIEFKKKSEKRQSSAALPLAEVPPVVFSETLLDIQALLDQQGG